MSGSLTQNHDAQASRTKEGKVSASRRSFLKQCALVAGLTPVAMVIGQDLGIMNIVATAASLQPKLRSSSTPTYVIQQSGSSIVATPADGSGLPLISNSDAATVINQALKPNARVLILAGTYVINSTIVGSGSQVELFGEGPATVLKLNNGANTQVISLQNANNWLIHDLQIDGNKANQSQTAAPKGSNSSGYPALKCMGISIWSATNATIANCYIHDCRCNGINISASPSCSVTGCVITNCDANGITMDSSVVGTNCAVSNNTVDGASDVGITAWNGVRVTIKSNIVRNVNLNSSPYSENTHIGIMFEGTTGCDSCTCNNNVIENCDCALSTIPHSGKNTNCIFDSNTASACGVGVYINDNDNITVNQNTFDGITNPNGFPMQIGQYTTGSIITGNTISNVVTTLKNAIIVLVAPSGVLTGNTIHTGGKLMAILQNPLKLPGGPWTIQNNTIVP